MREIKFRVWDERNNEMIYSEKFLDVIRDTHFNGNKLMYEAPEFSHTIYESLDEEIKLMQYTGLTDKNGKEIYEGDYLNSHAFLELGLVTFIDGAFWVVWEEEARYLSDLCGDCEIIGNRFENPELKEGT